MPPPPLRRWKLMIVKAETNAAETRSQCDPEVGNECRLAAIIALLLPRPDNYSTDKSPQLAI